MYTRKFVFLTFLFFFFLFFFFFFFSRSYETAWKDDKAVLAWLNESSAVIDTKINELKTASITNQICELGKTLPSAAIDGLIEMMSSMDEVTRQSMIQTFHDKLQKLKF